MDMGMKKIWFVMGIGGLVAGCAPQAPANVVSGLGNSGGASYDSNGYKSYTDYAPAVTLESRAPTTEETNGAVAETATTEPLVSRDEQARASATASKAERLALIEPAAGPNEQPVIASRRVEVSTVKVEPVQVEPTVVTHQVKATDTGYKLARQYDTSVSRILQDNNLKAVTDIREGMELQIAQNSNPRTSAWDDMKRALSEPVAKTQVVQGTPTIDQNRLDTVEPAAGRIEPAAAKPTDVTYVRHTVQPKETIYRISLQYNTSVLDIMAANDFVEPQDLKSDTVIKVPLRGSVSNQIAVKGANVAPAAGEVVPVVIETNNQPVQVAMLTKVPLVGSAEAKTEALETKSVQQQALTDAALPTQKKADLETDILKLAEAKRGQVDSDAARTKGLAWPVKGQVIRKFGDDGSGVARTGINIAVPKGTPVLASEGGQVLYADEGLKIYGKMVLVRHDNGMVSAYAHNSYLLVKKNERVKKGQVIALSGNSGNVESPQLHFELRQHASAVDPIAMLPRL